MIIKTWEAGGEDHGEGNYAEAVGERTQSQMPVEGRRLVLVL